MEDSYGIVSTVLLCFVNTWSNFPRAWREARHAYVYVFDAQGILHVSETTIQVRRHCSSTIVKELWLKPQVLFTNEKEQESFLSLWNLGSSVFGGMWKFSASNLQKFSTNS